MSEQASAHLAGIGILVYSDSQAKDLHYPGLVAVACGVVGWSVSSLMIDAFVTIIDTLIILFCIDHSTSASAADLDMSPRLKAHRATHLFLRDVDQFSGIPLVPMETNLALAGSIDDLDSSTCNIGAEPNMGSKPTWDYDNYN